MFKNRREVHSEVIKILEDAGITNYICMFKDPDSDTNFYSGSGSSEWIIGACEHTKYRELHGNQIKAEGE